MRVHLIPARCRRNIQLYLQGAHGVPVLFLWIFPIYLVDINVRPIAGHIFNIAPERGQKGYQLDSLINITGPE